jgi:PAS domain S-box-containing protein
MEPSASATTALARARRRLMIRRLPLFAAAWLSTALVWVVVLVLLSPQALLPGLVTVAGQLVLLVGAGVWARRALTAAGVRSTLIVACVGLGASSTLLLASAGTAVDVLAFVLLTLFLAAALLFAWGWRAELMVVAATLAIAAATLRFRNPVVPAPAFATAILIGTALALAVAEGSARAFATAVRHRASDAERERELEISRNAYRDLAENARDFIYSGDLAGRITYVNAPLAAFVGEPVEAIVGRFFHEFMTPHPDNPDLDAVLARVGAGQSVPLLTFATTTAAGSRWVEVLPSGVKGVDGRIVGVRGIGRDVTERWQAAEALRESEERFRSAFDSASVGVVIVGTDGRATQVNAAFCAMVGYDEAGLLDMPFEEVCHPDDLDATIACVSEALRGGAQSYHLEKRYRHKQGDTVWGLLSSALVRDARGEPLYFISQIQDITERKAAEEALRESELRYRGLVESQHDLIVRFDTALRLTFVNDAYCAKLGHSREELLGRSWLRLVEPDDLSALLEQVPLLDVPPYRIRADVRARAAEGERWIAWEGSAIKDVHGVTIEFQTVGRDVTERRAAEQALRASVEELRRSEERLRLLTQREAKIREDERKRLGFDLHDNVCQELIGIAILVESLRRRVAPLPGATADELDRVVRYLHELVEHLRVLARDMRPMLLRDLGLEGSLRSLAEGMTSTTTSVTAEFTGVIPRLDEEFEVAVYRIAQEALANAVRHAAAAA